MGINIRLYYVFLLSAGLVLFAPFVSYAADYSPGDACSASGAFHQTNDSDGMDFLICDGSNWQSAIYFLSGGGVAISSLTGLPAPQFSSSGLSDDSVLETHLKAVNTATDEECLTFETTTGDFEWQACDGAETDPEVNTLTASKWCTTDGSVINCTSDAPSSGLWTIGSGDAIHYSSGTPLVGIGDTTPEEALDVVGNIDFTGVITDVSDRRLKENITPLTGSLEHILALEAFSFTMKGDETGTVELGLLAQDVEPHYPMLVKTKDSGFKTLNYMGLIAPIVAAMHEQQEVINALEARNADLETRLQALEARYGTGASPEQEESGGQ